MVSIGAVRVLKNIAQRHNPLTPEGRKTLITEGVFGLSGITMLPGQAAAQTYYDINIKPFKDAADSTLGCAYDLHFRQEQNGEISSWFNTNSKRCYDAVAGTPASDGTGNYLPGGAGEQGINEIKFNLNPRQIRFNMQRATGPNWYELQRQGSRMVYNPHNAQIPAVSPVTQAQNINSLFGTHARPIPAFRTIPICYSVAKDFNNVTVNGAFSGVRAICN